MAATLATAATAAAAAQEHHHPPAPAASPSPRAEERTLFQSDMTLMAGMTPRDPMASMPMPRWTWMTMGIARLVFNHQGGLSGGEEVESSNWFMGMGQRDAWGGRLTLMAMNSLEPATLHAGGSPLLFQVGETFEGRPLVDHQHPHDFFMNLS